MWGALIPLIASVVPALFANRGNSNSGSNGQQAVDPMLQALLPDMQAMFRSQFRRQQASDPLYQQVLQMASRQLPTWSRGNFLPFDLGPLASGSAIQNPGRPSPPAVLGPTKPEQNLPGDDGGNLNRMVADIINRGGR